MGRRPDVTTGPPPTPQPEAQEMKINNHQLQKSAHLDREDSGETYSSFDQTPQAMGFPTSRTLTETQGTAAMVP